MALSAPLRPVAKKKIFFFLKYMTSALFWGLICPYSTILRSPKNLEMGANGIYLVNNVALSPSLLYNIGDYLSEDTWYILFRGEAEDNIIMCPRTNNPL